IRDKLVTGVQTCALPIFKASIAAVLPAPSAAAQSDPSQLTQRDRKLNEPAQPSASENQTVGVRSVTTAAVTPTREEIKNAYQSRSEERRVGKEGRYWRAQ